MNKIHLRIPMSYQKCNIRLEIFHINSICLYTVETTVKIITYVPSFK